MSNEFVEVFEGKKVFFRNNNGQPEVKIDEVALFCGWTRIATSGNEVIRWERVNEHLSELGVPTCGHGDYIPEYIMYPLIGKAKNNKATKFMIWVGHIMTQLRTKGVVILDHAEDEAIDFEKKFGKYRIRKTFTNSNDVIGDYKQYIELSKVEWKSKRLNNVERVKLSNIIVSAIEDRLSENVLTLKPSEILQLQELISDIKSDVIKLSNKKNGGDKTAQTKKIKKLEQRLIELDDTYIPDDTAGIYSIQCLVNEKRYIGRSKDIARRFSQHKGELESGTHWIKSLQRDWNKYGAGRFKFEVIEDTDDLDLEGYYIEHYDTTNKVYGYNTYKTGGQY